eukprot:COSAG04_NODE_1363_length_7079_cov_19.484815_6_plen_171_part_00
MPWYVEHTVIVSRCCLASTVLSLLSILSLTHVPTTNLYVACMCPARQSHGWWLQLMHLDLELLVPDRPFAKRFVRCLATNNHTCPVQSDLPILRSPSASLSVHVWPRTAGRNASLDPAGARPVRRPPRPRPRIPRPRLGEGPTAHSFFFLAAAAFVLGFWSESLAGPTRP